MTLKEELEILRGEPIQVCTGDPMDIPCIETSDPDKLCKHPVVSVNMITYNHEPYIRQAIEGVMMQKTDFEFELVIGEDASTDKTREICFEYQKKYPDKIRVLWWHENLRKVNHPGGGNSARVRARCRGEFIALCEGDDYWIDPLKLQKQVDEIRKMDAVICLASCEWHYPDGRIQEDKFSTVRTLLMLEDVARHYFHTTTYLFRRGAYAECLQAYKDMPIWYDTILLNCMASMGRVCYIPDVVSVYNWTGHGAGGRPGDGKRAILQVQQKVALAFWGPQCCHEYYVREALSSLEMVMFCYDKHGHHYSRDLRRRCRRAYRILFARPLPVRFWARIVLSNIKARLIVVYLKLPWVRVVWQKIKNWK